MLTICDSHYVNCLYITPMSKFQMIFKNKFGFDNTSDAAIIPQNVTELNHCLEL